MENKVSTECLYRLIREMLCFPCPTICRHDVSMSLLSIIEEETGNIDRELVEHIAKASEGDYDALRRMDKLGIGKTK